ncbi:MAG: type II toxin-antitoxin system RelB/DinJ family antitoxin [Clostridiales Family XIII bacterium]|jgi:DNA-damage-inducible protein J|nr:type II toxin-antitoxin system RelB/DinJ family antitoxin [Clostridiales Family XIII bacterium]
MNSETTNLSIRMDKALKEQAENLFSELGMNMTTAFNIFVRQSVRQGKIPFEISLGKPNAVTQAALQEIEDMRQDKIPKQSSSVADFIKEMNV